MGGAGFGAYPFTKRSREMLARITVWLAANPGAWSTPELCKRFNLPPELKRGIFVHLQLVQGIRRVQPRSIDTPEGFLYRHELWTADTVTDLMTARPELAVLHPRPRPLGR